MEELFSHPDLFEFPTALHKSMLQDEERMNLFTEAMKETIQPGDTVIDLGSGTGVLSFLAYQLGATKVVGIEKSPLAAYAKKVLEMNLPEANISFINQDIKSVENIDLKADVLICELFGNFGVDEGVLDILSFAKEHLLKPGGRILPESMDLIMAPVQCTKDYRAIANWNFQTSNIDFSPIQPLAFNCVYQIDSEPVRLLDNPKSVCHFDFSSKNQPGTNFAVEFETIRDGTLHGFAGWFRSKLSKSVCLDTGPNQSATHWGQVLFPSGEPLSIKKGTSMYFKFSENLKSKSSTWSWSGAVKSRSKSQKETKFSFSAKRKFL